MLSKPQPRPTLSIKSLQINQATQELLHLAPPAIPSHAMRILEWILDVLLKKGPHLLLRTSSASRCQSLPLHILLCSYNYLAMRQVSRLSCGAMSFVGSSMAFLTFPTSRAPKGNEKPWLEAHASCFTCPLLLLLGHQAVVLSPFSELQALSPGISSPGTTIFFSELRAAPDTSELPRCNSCVLPIRSRRRPGKNGAQRTAKGL